MKNCGKYAKIAIVITAALIAAAIKMCSAYGNGAVRDYIDRQTADTVLINSYLDSIDRTASEKDSLKAARRKAREANKKRATKIRSLLDEPVPSTLPDEKEKN